MILAYWRNIFGYFFIGIFSFVIFSCCGCESNTSPNNLTEAYQYIEKKEWSAAERYLELYLREEERLDLRFEAWNKLLEVGGYLTYNDNWLISCLEEMYSEFEDQPEQMKSILWRLALAYDRIRNYNKSIEYWEKLFIQPGLSVEQQANILRKLASSSVKIHRFDIANNYLKNCLELPLSSINRLECLLDRADIASSMGLFDEGASYALLVLESDEASIELKGKAGFILADIKEQQGNIQKAIELFKSIREYYPNAMVVDQRLQLLQAKNKH